MVVKTERCAFSEFLVFPGHGMRFIRKDGQPILLGSSKSKSLYMQRLKPSKLQWTQGWRRLNKKALADTISKKRTRKNTKVQRAIVGVSLDEIKKIRNQKPQEKSAARAAALKEVKDRNKKVAAAKKSAAKGPASKGPAKHKGSTKGANKASVGR